MENKDTTNQPNPKVSKLNFLKSRYVLIALSVVVLAAVVAGGIYLSKNIGKTPYSFKYSANTDTNVTAPGSYFFIFKRPAEFKPTTKDNKYPQQLFVHKVTVNSKQVTSGYLYASSLPLTPESLKIVNGFEIRLKENPNTDSYKIGAKAITSNVHGILSPIYSNVTVGVAKPLRTKYIKNTAWQFDVTATNGKNGVPDQQGTAIYAWTGKAIYIYMFTTAKENWKPNQATVQQMLDSIRLQYIGNPVK